jgi:6-phosphogluconolactonase
MRAENLPERFDYPTHEDVAEALAVRVAGALGAAIAQRGHALIAVSGGNTPALFMQHLARAEIDWSKVTVTLVDERFVPEDSDRSNARLARINLLTGEAAAARFIPLYSTVSSVEEAAAAADATIGALPLPFDVVVLGQGADGHTASFFPDAPTLADLLDPQTKTIVAPVHAPSGGEPRLTLTLPQIAGARQVVLHIEGEAKRNVLASALAGADLPIAAVLSHTERPVEVYWAP